MLALAIGRDRKGKLSLVFYLVAIPLTALSAWAAASLYGAVALVWLIPDRRVEKTLAGK